MFSLISEVQTIFKNNHISASSCNQPSPPLTKHFLSLVKYELFLKNNHTSTSSYSFVIFTLTHLKKKFSIKAALDK